MGEVVALVRAEPQARPPELVRIGRAPPRRDRDWWRLRAALAAIGVCLLVMVSRDTPAMPMFVANFQGDGLISNEFATLHPDAPDAVRSGQWEVTSGSLFAHDGAATNGQLDRESPNAGSTDGTDSSVFRAYTLQSFTPDYTVRFQMRVSAPRVVSGQKAAAWDGVHLIVIARSPAAAYYVSLFRRDGRVVIKKKSAGGPIAGGTYQSLSKYVDGGLAQNEWTDVRLDVRQSETGAVTLDLYEGGKLMTTATDDVAVSGSHAFVTGRLGLRADNTTFEVRRFTVSRL